MQRDLSFLNHIASRSAQKNNYKPIITYLSFFCIMALFFNFYLPAKYFLFDLTEQIEDLGFFGSLFLISFNGLLIIPLGFPYLIVEIVTSLLIRNFWSAMFLSMASKALGCSICFWIARSRFGTKIRQSLHTYRIYIGVEHLLEKNPWKFLMLFRLILIPYAIKNYGLSFARTVNYMNYIVSALVATTPYSMINIHICQTVGNISEVLDESSTAQIIFTIIVILVSASLMIYLFFYTKKIVSLLEDNESVDLNSSRIELPRTLMFDDISL